MVTKLAFCNCYKIFGNNLAQIFKSKTCIPLFFRFNIRVFIGITFKAVAVFQKFAGNGFYFITFLAVTVAFCFRNFADKGSFITFLGMDMLFRFFADKLFAGIALFGMEMAFFRFANKNFFKTFFGMEMRFLFRKFTKKNLFFRPKAAFGMGVFFCSAEGFPFLCDCRKDERIGGAENNRSGKHRKNFQPDFFSAVLLRIFFHSLFKITFQNAHPPSFFYFNFLLLFNNSEIRNRPYPENNFSDNLLFRNTTHNGNTAVNRSFPVVAHQKIF